MSGVLQVCVHANVYHAHTQIVCDDYTPLRCGGSCALCRHSSSTLPGPASGWNVVIRHHGPVPGYGHGSLKCSAARLGRNGETRRAYACAPAPSRPASLHPHSLPLCQHNQIGASLVRSYTDPKTYICPLGHVGPYRDRSGDLTQAPRCRPSRMRSARSTTELKALHVYFQAHRLPTLN